MVFMPRVTELGIGTFGFEGCLCLVRGLEVEDHRSLSVQEPRE